MNQYIYGLDFGTSNSALAILKIKTNEIVKVFTIPSVIFFPERKGSVVHFVGKEAIEAYVSCKMKGRFMKSIKKVLPNKSFTTTNIGNKAFKIEELVALIISNLKKQADEFIGEKISTAVIGRPVVFDEKSENDQLAQERLSKAVELAGFTNYTFQFEPIAAAYTYERAITKEELVLVADFGGGTTDFTLMKLRPSAIDQIDRTNDIISKGGIYIGGDNFDADIMWSRGTPNFGRGVQERIDDKLLDLPNSYFLNICSWEKMNFLNSIKMIEAIKRSYVFSDENPKVLNLLTLIQKNLGYLLFKAIEKSKIELAQKSITHFQFKEHGIDFNEPINHKDFKDIIGKNLDKINSYLDKYMVENKLDYNEIDSVFMTGGTSQVKALKDLFNDKFSSNAVKSGDNFNSVAMGLAYSYGSLNL